MSLLREWPERFALITSLACLGALFLGAPASAQRGGLGPGPPPSAEDAAPVDLTGYWVSIVTEDWIERMAPDSPPSGTGGRGGFGGRGGAAPDVVSNPDEPCRVYGAAGSLRVPGRLHITWADPNTLQVDMDAGTQTRLFHFNPSDAPPTERSLQGYSVARWETGQGGGGGRGRGRGAPAPPEWGGLTVVTTNMTGGYLLTPRASYSENATLTEHFTYHSDFGVEYFTVTAIVDDDGGNRITSSTFKKEADGSRFNPTGCEIVR